MKIYQILLNRITLKRIVLIAIIPFICLGLSLVFSWSYTTLQLRAGRTRGVYASAEEGMADIIAKNYAEPYHYQILHAGPNQLDGSSPHVWYVTAYVWGTYRSDGSTLGNERHNYDMPGTFFLHTRDGWVHMPEGAFPGFIGNWMAFYGMAGPESSQP